MSRRESCTLCLRPQSSCICRWITPVAHEVEVLILQHPMEVTQAKGSARLLHLSLPGSRLLTGEVFHMHGVLADADAAEGRPRHTLLLYPDTVDTGGDELRAPAALREPSPRREPSQVRLIVLDGTWRKSRKMLYLNPLLQQLPRLALRDMPPSNYRIRQAHKPQQLSTLEATCAALAQLESDHEKFLPLLTAFDGFVAQQMGWRPGRRRAGLLLNR